MNPLTRSRTMILVDIENLCATPRFHAVDVVAVRAVVERISDPPNPTQAVVVAASSGEGLVEAGLGWAGARKVWRPGHDGADLALADVALNENVPERFDRVVICSGDGLFAAVARYLIHRGVQVTVLARNASLSRRLAHAVDDVRLIDDELRAA